MRDKWLEHFDVENRENALCLAVFAAQELELEVPNEALPQPGKTRQLLRLGLVAQTERGLFGQYRRFKLRESSWGRLLLATQVPPLDEEKILFETAARDAMLATILSARLRREGLVEHLLRLWAYLATARRNLIKLIPDLPLTFFPNLVQAAKKGQQPLLANRFWAALESAPDKLAERAWETPLDQLGSFLDTAKEHGRDTAALWAALESAPDKLAERAWETPLDQVGSFLDTAKEHGRDTASLWEAIEHEPDKLAERAWETPLDQLGSFLDTAKEHGRDTAALWAALESAPDKLAERAWETPLGNVGSFLDTARRHRRKTASLWEAIEHEPDKLAERAWETPLGDVGSFLDTAKEHGRDTAALWAALESAPDKLAERAWETPLGNVAGFQNVAKEHERDPRPLWEALESKPEQLSALAKETPVVQLAGFCRHAPETVAKIALADLQPTHWDGVSDSKLLVGAASLAYCCAEAGREDLKSAIITKLLLRANPRDFPPSDAGLVKVAWLVKNVPSGASLLVPTFLNALCTKRWLGWQFRNAASGPLAGGLRLLALHQPPQVCRRFQNPGLGIRIWKDLSRFAQVDQQEQSQIIQLLGCATLCGWSERGAWFKNLPLRTVGKLPADTLPHGADAEKVEDWQFQLWLGLRAVTSVTGKPLTVPAALIAHTLDLWRSNLAESSSKAASAEYRVNQSMVTWLETCSRNNQGLLLPTLKLTVNSTHFQPRSS